MQRVSRRTLLRQLGAAFLTMPAACGRAGCKLGDAESTLPLGVECEVLPPLPRKSSYSVGFVPIYEPTNPWGITNTNDMLAQAVKRGYKPVYTPLSQGDVVEQVARMQTLITAKVDLIVLRPMASGTLAPVVVAARKACIPVFTENRFLDPTRAVPGEDYVTGIGADPVFQGQLVAEWLIKATDGKATIVEIEGTPGSSSSIGRKKGFDEEIAKHEKMKIVASRAGNFLRADGHDVAKALLTQYPETNVIYSHGDIMALGALAAVKELRRVPGKDVLIVSVDGLREAVEHVMDGSIAAIAFNDPRFGAIVFDTVEKYAAGQIVEPRIIVKGPIIDRLNASMMLAEAF